MLKSPERISELVARRFASSFAREAVAEVLGPALGDGCLWPYSVPLGNLAKRELVEGIDALVAYTQRLDALAGRHGLAVEYSMRIAGGRQRVPSHVVVPSLDAAASVAGRGAQAQLRRARERARVLCREFAERDPEQIVQAVRKCDALDDVDFDLVVTAARWFAAHDASGMTPRQVPLEGFHAKWLDSAGHRRIVALLSGKDSLGLASRPAQVEFSYLDPEYLASEKRRLDSCVLGDSWELPYEPDTVVIVENKDTYLWFPQVEGGVCVFGAGKAGIASVPQLGWVRECPHLFYWGDMDADGLEILDAYRAAGLDVSSVLMDIQAYRRYERYGTSRTPGKRPLDEHVPKELPHLQPDELKLYRMLTSPEFTGPRRIEQERIPLNAALAHLS